MKYTITTAALTLALVAVADRPLAAQNRHELQMAAELRILREQQQELALAIAELSRSLSDITKAIGARVDATNETLRKGFADQALTLNGVAQDISVIRAQSQDSNTRLLQLQDEIKALQRSLPALLTQFARPPAPVDPNAPIDPTAPPPDPSQAVGPLPPALPPADPPPSAAGLSPGRLFDTAYADYAAGNFTQAILGFEQYVRTFPSFEQADDALSFIGQAHDRQNNFDEAIAAYNRIIRDYPNGDEIDMAYYRRGFTEQRQGRVDAARVSWQEVIKRFPKSNGALLAQQRLDGLGREPAAQ